MQTALREWAYATSYDTSEQRNAASGGLRHQNAITARQPAKAAPHRVSAPKPRRKPRLQPWQSASMLPHSLLTAFVGCRSRWPFTGGAHTRALARAKHARCRAVSDRVASAYGRPARCSARQRRWNRSGAKDGTPFKSAEGASSPLILLKKKGREDPRFNG
jgi:hypothetical protein